MLITYMIAAAATFVFTTAFTTAGVGSASLLIPTFLFLGFPLLTAMSTALLLNAIAMTFASLSYARKRLIMGKLAIPLVVAAAVLSPLGAHHASEIPRDMLLWFFSGFLIFAGSMMFFFRPKAANPRLTAPQMFGYGAGIGSVAGYLGGLLGVGGGNFIVPALVSLGFDPKRTAATTAPAVLFASLTGFLTHASAGFMDVRLIAFCAVASAAGALLGAYLLEYRLNPGQGKTAIGAMLYTVAAVIVWGLLSK